MQYKHFPVVFKLRICRLSVWCHHHYATKLDKEISVDIKNLSMQLDVKMVIYCHKKKSQDMIDSNFYNLTSLFVSINILYYMSNEIIQSSLIFLLTNMVIMILIFLSYQWNDGCCFCNTSSCKMWENSLQNVFFNCSKNGECCSLRRFHLVIGMLFFIPEIFTCISTLINRNVLKF